MRIEVSHNNLSENIYFGKMNLESSYTKDLGQEEAKDIEKLVIIIHAKYIIIISIF